MLVEVDYPHGYHLAALAVIVHLLFRVKLAILEVYLSALGDNAVYLVEIFKQVEGRGGCTAQRYAADKVTDLSIGAHTLKLVYELLFLLRGQELVD